MLHWKHQHLICYWKGVRSFHLSSHFHSFPLCLSPFLYSPVLSSLTPSFLHFLPFFLPTFLTSFLASASLHSLLYSAQFSFLLLFPFHPSSPSISSSLPLRLSPSLPPPLFLKFIHYLSLFNRARTPLRTLIVRSIHLWYWVSVHPLSLTAFRKGQMYLCSIW